MTVRRQAIHDGDRELRRTSHRFGEELRELRLRGGLSQAAVAEAIGVDRSVITRIERGDVSVSMRTRARACACLGADFRVQLYRERSPLLFDGAHARIVDRILSGRNPLWRAQVEAPVPGSGRRSVDIRLDAGEDVILVEVETRLRRLEEIVRELHAKRDAVLTAVPLGSRVHCVLAIPPTRHHRAVVREHATSMAIAFPVPPEVIRHSLTAADGSWPGDGILFVAGS